MMEERISRFNKLLMSTGRKGMTDLINALTVQGFYRAPCSTAFHCNYEGGLLVHSLNLYDFAWKIYTRLELNSIPFDSVVIAALLHDVGKAGWGGSPYYEPNYLKNGELSTAKPYVRSKNLQNVPHEIMSVLFVSQYIELTEAEKFAVIYHMGQYSDLKNQLAGNEQPLQMLISFSDLWATKIIEVEVK